MGTRDWGEDDTNFFLSYKTKSATEIIDEYVNQHLLKVKNVSEKHAYDVATTLRRVLVDWANSEGIAIQRWGGRAMDARVAERRDEAKSDWTIRHEVAKCKALFHWLYAKKRFPIDLLDNYELPDIKVLPNDSDAATVDDINGWLRANREYYQDTKIVGAGVRHARSTPGYMLRDALAVLIMCDSAVRPAELFRIRLDWLQKDEHGTYISMPTYSTKTNTERKLYLSHETVEKALMPWLEFRKRIRFSSPDQGYLLCQRGEANADKRQCLDAGTWGRQFKKRVLYAKAKGYIPESKRITPYSLRDYSIQCLNRVSVKASMQISGHSGKSSKGVHAGYDKTMTAGQMEALDRAQEEAAVRMAHSIAAPVSGLVWEA